MGIKIKTFQSYVATWYEKRGYTNDILTLTLGLCEEVGEVAKAVNVFYNSEYKLSPHSQSDSLEHELTDALVYLCGIANVANIDLDAVIQEKMK